MTVLRAVGRFWYDLLVGDDWKIAAVVLAVLALGAAMMLAGVAATGAFAVLLGAALVAAFVMAVLVDARSR